jgi:two-component system chemotaxis sensor kinase CheA
LTLAIIDGLLVTVDDDHYVLPLAAIEECQTLDAAAMAKIQGCNIINLRGRTVPIISLREHFNVQSPPPSQQQVIIGLSEGQRVGIVVDQVIGQQQIVIKSLSKLYRDVEEISGATILGDGSVALILDLTKLLILLSGDTRAKAA